MLFLTWFTAVGNRPCVRCRSLHEKLPFSATKVSDHPTKRRSGTRRSGEIYFTMPANTERFSRNLSGAERLHLRSLLMRRDFSQTKYILIYSNVIRKGLPLHRSGHRRLACVRSLWGHGGCFFFSGPTLCKGPGVHGNASPDSAHTQSHLFSDDALGMFPACLPTRSSNAGPWTRRPARPESLM